MEPAQYIIVELCPVAQVTPVAVINPVNKTDICKLCLNLTELKSLTSIQFSNTYNNLKFLENELKFLLPNEVCIYCWQKLKDILSFVKKCKDSYLIYSKMQQNCKLITEENTTIVANEDIQFEEIILDQEIVTDTDVVTEEKIDIKEEVFEENITGTLKEANVAPVEKDVIKQTKISRHKSQICSTCGIKLTTTISAHYQESRHCRPKNYKCEMCNTYYHSRYRLQIHQQVKHSKMKFMCNICSKFLKNPVCLKRHVREHLVSNKFTCEICKKSFKRKEYLVKHMNAHQKGTLKTNRKPKQNNEQQYCCKYCSSNFDFYNTFFKHLQTHKEIDSDNTIVFKEGDLTCPVCKKEFTELRQLKIHSFTHKEKRVYMCVQCQDFFDNGLAYRIHLKSVHDKDKKFTCPKCFKKYRSQQCLTDHLRIHEDPQILCTYCGRKFRFQSHLTRHQAVVHNVNKGEPFRCKHCPKEFFCKGNLIIHERIHTGEKPYLCYVCDKSFIASNSRKMHVKRAHGELAVDKIKKYTEL